MAASNRKPQNHKATANPSSSVQCPHCKIYILSYALKRHLQRCPVAKIAKISIPTPIQPSANSKRKSVTKRPLEAIILKSRRGTRIRSNRQQMCDGCKKFGADWTYAESNYGRVCLCDGCKRTAYERSFGHFDVLDVAFSGGAIESNRRKH